jgi:NCS1 family nucleobase:cation symporter-1
MSTVLERDHVVPPAHGGAQPVPEAERTLSALDLAVLWGDLGIGLLVMVTGALLVPGLGFASAAVAVVIGSVIGVGLLAFGARIGAESGLPAMALFRPILGLKGSWAPSTLNVMQLIGWTAVELWAMSYVASIVSDRVFGFSARPIWLVFFALVCTTLALWGPVGVTRVWMEKFGVWVVGGISLAVTVLVLADDGARSALSAPGIGGFPTFGGALDLVIAMPISWLPLVADYTRYARRPSGAFKGTFWGYLVANVWLYLLGAAIVLGSASAPTPDGVAVGILALAGGSIAGILFLVGLVVGETDEAFANMYSGGVSLQNIFPKVSLKYLIMAIAGIGFLLAAGFNMVAYEYFLFLIGSVFVPLFGVLMAYRLKGPIVVTGDEPGFRWRALGPWALGFLLYHWISPSPLEWWSDLVRSLVGTPLGETYGWLSASIPAFLIAFATAAAVAPTYHRGPEEPGSSPINL